MQNSRSLGTWHPAWSPEIQKNGSYRGMTINLAYFHDMVNSSTSLSCLVASKIRKDCFDPCSCLGLVTSTTRILLEEVTAPTNQHVLCILV